MWLNEDQTLARGTSSLRIITRSDLPQEFLDALEHWEFAPSGWTSDLSPSALIRCLCVSGYHVWGDLWPQSCPERLGAKRVIRKCSCLECIRAQVMQLLQALSRPGGGVTWEGSWGKKDKQPVQREPALKCYPQLQFWLHISTVWQRLVFLITVLLTLALCEFHQTFMIHSGQRDEEAEWIRSAFLLHVSLDLGVNVRSKWAGF